MICFSAVSFLNSYLRFKINIQYSYLKEKKNTQNTFFHALNISAKSQRAGISPHGMSQDSLEM